MPRLRIAAFLVLLFPCASATAQTVYWHNSGNYADGNYGGNAAILGDVDGDGLDDVAVGDPDASPVLFLDGQVKVYSGQFGSEIFSIDAPNVLQGFGSDVDCAGDVNGDGVPDLVVASLCDVPEVYSGATGLMLFEMTSILGNISASRVAGVGDVNGDLFDDVIVSTPFATVGGNPSAGAAYVVSGRFMTNGLGPQFLHVFQGGQGDKLGTAVDGTDDLDGDTFPDLIVSAPDETGVVGFFAYTGVIHIYSGLTGQEIRAIRWFDVPGEFDYHVAHAGDLDQDGFPELVVGHPFIDANGTNSGRVHVYAGADGELMHTFVGNDASDFFGSSVAEGGDISGDGYPDLLIGASNDEGTDGVAGGALYIFSGFDGGLIRIVDVEEGALGTAVAGGGDFDGDAYADFVGGASAFNQFGRVYAFGGNCTGGNYAYCVSAPNSYSANGGSITASGSLSIAAQDLTLIARECPPNQTGVFYYGSTQVQIPWGDGFRCAAGDTFRINPPVTINSVGIATKIVDWTIAPVGSGPGMIQAGDTWNFSFWFRDPAAGGTGFNYTNARSLTFCP